MPLVIPSFPQAYPKLLMNGDTTGQGIEGPAGAFSLEEATSYDDRVALSNKLPLPMTNGSHILPRDAQEATDFTAQHKSMQISDFRQGQRRNPESQARHLLLELRRKRGNLKSDQRCVILTSKSCRSLTT